MNILHNLTRKQIILYSAFASAVAVAMAVVLFAGGFRHTYPEELVAADSLCESKPDSARQLLGKLSAVQFGSKSDSMYYALLKIKAANNLYEPQKDSTIFRIVDYFDGHGDKSKRREAYYYLGKYYVEHNDAPYALKCFQTALDLSDGKTPLSFKSKVYSQSGTLLMLQDMNTDALEFYRKSFSCDSLLNDTINMIHGLRDIGQVYRHMNQTDSCELFLNRASALAAALGNGYLKHTISLCLLSVYIDESKTRNALNLLRKTLPYVDKNTVSPAYSAAVELYSKIHAEDSAFVYGKKLLSVGTLPAKEKSLAVLMDYYSKKNDLGNVTKCLEMYRAVSDSIRNTDSEEAVAKMNALYNYSLREKEIASLALKNQEKTYSIILFSFLLVIFFVLYVLFRIRSRARYSRLNNLYEHLGNMYEDAREQSETQIFLKDRRISELTEQLEMLDTKKTLETENYKRIIRELNSALSNAVKVADQRKIQKIAVYERIRQQLMVRKCISERSWKEIESSFVYIYPGFKEKLFDRYELDDYENRICILSKLGFLNSEIAILLSRTQGAITQMRSSLYKKLSGNQGNSKQFDALVKSL